MGTLTTLTTSVKYNIGGRSDKDSVITEALNSAVKDLAVLADWPDLETLDSSKSLAAAAYSITMPTSIRKVDKVRLKDASNNWYEVKYVGKSYFTEMYPEGVPTVTGQPSHCYKEAGTLYFDKLADVTYTVYIDGYKYPTDMSAGGDSPSIDNVDDILIAQATGYVFASLKQTDIAAFWFQVAGAKADKRLDEMTPSEVGHLEPW